MGNDNAILTTLDREQKKFTQDSDGDVAVNTISETVLVDPDTGEKATINASGQLKVVLDGKVSDSNSSSTPLLADATFEGTAVDTLDYALIFITVFSDVASATDGLQLQISSDNITWREGDCFNIPAGVEKTFSFQPNKQYVRIFYVNGDEDQAIFDLQTIFKKTNSKPSSHRIQDSIIDDDDATLQKSVLTGKNPAGTFVNFQATTAGNFKISLEELENVVSVNNNSQLRTTSFHSDGTPGQLLTGVDYVVGKSGIDAVTETQISIEYEHHEIHAGNHYGVCDYLSYTNGQVVDWTVIVPDTGELAHMLFNIEGTGAISLNIYEVAVPDAVGSVVTPINNNRNSDNTSSLIVRNGDTFTGIGNKIFGARTGANKEVGIIARTSELILKSDTTYLFRITNETSLANVVSWCAEWYEIIPRN